MRRPDGTVVDVGRTRRLANRGQRRALRAMYPTCAFHGCDVSFDRCEIHHIVPFEIGGATDLANLLPLCSGHHHVVHELQWRLELDEHRTLIIRDRDGGVHAEVPLPSAPTERVDAHRSEDRRPSEAPDGTGLPPDPPPGRPPDRLRLIA